MPGEIARLASTFCVIQIELFPFDEKASSPLPTGNISAGWNQHVDVIGHQMAFLILLSRRRANSWNTSPRRFFITPKIAFLRYFGMKTT